jgi:hypothetical protein
MFQDFEISNGIERWYDLYKSLLVNIIYNFVGDKFYIWKHLEFQIFLQTLKFSDLNFWKFKTI